MASSIERYTLGWNEYANNFSISFADLLNRKALVDVTLVADGHLFSAHRLVLSALSPFFEQMFTQMPTNQQAFVFLKDVSKETLEDLIMFIYSGRVDVKYEHLEEFFKTAKALDIKGLADDEYANLSNIQSPISPIFNSFKPKFDGIQYQSTQTIPVLDQVKPNRDAPNHFETTTSALRQFQNNFESEYTNEMNEHGESYSNIYDDEFDESENGIGDSLDPNDGSQADQWNVNDIYAVEEEPTNPKAIRPMKRVKTNIDTAEYNIVADILPNGRGGDNLIYNGMKFRKSNKPNYFGQQRWACTKRTPVNKCQATVSTMDTNGVIMMKIVYDEHSH